MKINTHNEIIDVDMNIKVTKDYPIILDSLLVGKKKAHSCYFNFFLDCLIADKSSVMRTKTCMYEEQIKYELRDKYNSILKLSIKNQTPIKIKKVTINNIGVLN